MESENHHFNSKNSGKESSWMLKLITGDLIRNSSLKIPPSKIVSRKEKTNFTVTKSARQSSLPSDQKLSLRQIDSTWPCILGCIEETV